MQLTLIDSEVANDPHSTANAAVPAGFAGLPPAERFISNLEIIRTYRNPPNDRVDFFTHPVHGDDVSGHSY
jgi:hypothetical protein